MKVIYDAKADVLRIIFREAIVEDFSEDRPGVVVNYDAEDQMIAIEIQQASKLTDNPRSIDHTVVD